MKKAFQMSMEKVIALIIVIVVLAITLMFILSEGGPKDMIDSIINFFNQTTNIAIN